MMIGIKIIKKYSLLLIIFILLISLSGCETVEAVRTGGMKMQDVEKLVAVGFANSEDAGETGIFAKIDTWMRKNLW